jgi:hypothetical protein
LPNMKKRTRPIEFVLSLEAINKAAATEEVDPARSAFECGPIAGISCVIYDFEELIDRESAFGKLFWPTSAV